jgi:hypothetical protein
MEAERLGQEKAAQEAADATVKTSKPAEVPEDKTVQSKHKKEKKPANFSAKVIESKKKTTP